MSEDAQVSLDDDELIAINNALNEVLSGPDAIEDWDFRTRMGVTRDQPKQVLQKVGALIPDLGPPR